MKAVEAIVIMFVMGGVSCLLIKRWWRSMRERMKARRDARQWEVGTEEYKSKAFPYPMKTRVFIRRGLDKVIVGDVPQMDSNYDAVYSDLMASASSRAMTRNTIK